jgi:hypothetical protein
MRIHRFVSAAIVAAMVSVAPAKAAPSVDDVKTWTRAQWAKAVAEFSHEKAKWGDCRKQSKEMKLRGKESWSFLYGCMKG